MLISRTPLRISFLGGGTDLPSFFREEEGACISTTIDKSISVIVSDRFDESYRLCYGKTEIVNSPNEIDHKIIRAVLERYAEPAKAMTGRGLEILSTSDIPAGTGLGSSSAFTVGLLNAIKSHLNQTSSAAELAEEASKIEIEDLLEPIGKQDQYAAAFGGLKLFRFLPSGKVVAEPIRCSEKTKREVESSTMVFYTGITRAAGDVFGELNRNLEPKREALRELKRLTYRLKEILEAGEASKVGELLHAGWEVKRTLATGISATQIDEWYERAMKAGASGGKIIGAGGGGFLMVACEPEKQAKVREELSDLRELRIRFEDHGSRIIFVG